MAAGPLTQYNDKSNPCVDVGASAKRSLERAGVPALALLFWSHGGKRS